MLYKLALFILCTSFEVIVAELCGCSGGGGGKDNLVFCFTGVSYSSALCVWWVCVWLNVSKTILYFTADFKEVLRCLSFMIFKGNIEKKSLKRCAFSWWPQITVYYIIVLCSSYVMLTYKYVNEVLKWSGPSPEGHSHSFIQYLVVPICKL